MSDLVQALQERIEGALESVGRMTSIGSSIDAPDSTTKLLVRDAAGREVAVVLCSAPASPLLVTRGMALARRAKELLGPRAGGPIFDALGEGEVQGLGYAILPYCAPLSHGRFTWPLQRARLRPVVLAWLRDVARLTRYFPVDEELERGFVQPLERLARQQGLDDRVRALAQRALQRLDSGRWVPCHVLMHGDLWRDNVLIDRRGFTEPRERGWARHFVVIDWAGASERGHALYDLVRWARSTRLRATALGQELTAHCALLDCAGEDALGHLLAALGAIGENLEYFPLPDYLRMARDTVQCLERALVQ